MKKIAKILVLAAVVSLFTITKSKAQISVNLQLRRPAQYERNEREHPNRPSSNYMWVAEEWVPNGRGSYDYKPGYWTVPPKLSWAPGHWSQGYKGGYVWVPGRWQIFLNGQWQTIVPRS